MAVLKSLPEAESPCHAAHLDTEGILGRDYINKHAYMLTSTPVDPHTPRPTTHNLAELSGLLVIEE